MVLSDMLHTKARDMAAAAKASLRKRAEERAANREEGRRKA